MFCQTCKTKSTCNKVCDKVNEYLHSKGIYSADYIRPSISSKRRTDERKKDIFLSKYREIPFSNLKNRDKDGVFTGF
jgi:hypothetical protein